MTERWIDWEGEHEEVVQDWHADRIVMTLYREGHDAVELTVPHNTGIQFKAEMVSPPLPDPTRPFGPMPQTYMRNLRLIVSAPEYEMRQVPKKKRKKK